MCSSALCLLLPFLLLFAGCRGLDDGGDTVFRSFAEQKEIVTFELGKEWAVPRDWAVFHKDSILLCFEESNAANGAHFCKAKSLSSQEDTDQCVPWMPEGYDCTSETNCVYAPEAMETIERKDESSVVIYVFDKGRENEDNGKCEGAKVLKLVADENNELSLESTTKVEGTRCSEDIIFSMTVDPDEGWVFITAADVGSANPEIEGETYYYVFSIGGEHSTAQDVLAPWHSSDGHIEEVQMNYLYGVALTQKYSVVSWSPSTNGSLFLIDKYYLTNADNNGLYKGKSIASYAEIRSKNGTSKDTKIPVNMDCRRGFGITSDQNDNLYFLQKVEGTVSSNYIKLWKGISCVSLKKLESKITINDETGETATVLFNNNLHIADEQLIFLQSYPTDESATRYSAQGLFIGANSYAYIKDHYESVVDESVFMGTVFGVYFGALVIGIAVISIRIFLNKRNQ